MSLLQYYVKAKVVPTAEETGIGQKPTAEANKCVAELLERQQLGQSTGKRRATAHSEEAWAKIGKYASINGTASARRRFKNVLGDLSESTVRKYKQLYFLRLLNVMILATSLLFHRRSEDDHLRWDKAWTPISRSALRLAGTPVSQGATLTKQGSKDRTVLIDNRGHVSLTRGWALSLLRRMGYIKRKASTKTGKLSNEQFGHRRHKFLLEISGMVRAQGIPDELVLNWDQTGLHLVPSGNWTLEKEGASRVEVVGQNDKHMITATIATL